MASIIWNAIQHLQIANSPALPSQAKKILVSLDLLGAIRRWRVISAPGIPADVRKVLDSFNRLADERDKLNRDLIYAYETISTLSVQLGEYEFLLKEAQERIAKRTELSMGHLQPEPPKSQVETNTAVDWIEDIWLCRSKDSALLGEAEAQWKNRSPQQALITASQLPSTRAKAGKKLGLVDQLKCHLLVAALLHFGGKYDESCDTIDMVRKTTQEQVQVCISYAQTREIYGIGYFIEGKNLLGMRIWQLAYWSFSKALYTPGYHAKAQRLQKEAINRVQRED